MKPTMNPSPHYELDAAITVAELSFAFSQKEFCLRACDGKDPRDSLPSIMYNVKFSCTIGERNIDINQSWWIQDSETEGQDNSWHYNELCNIAELLGSKVDYYDYGVVKGMKVKLICTANSVLGNQWDIGQLAAIGTEDGEKFIILREKPLNGLPIRKHNILANSKSEVLQAIEADFEELRSKIKAKPN
ncbi:hypothetical protein FWC63_01660 [Candidatus Saccharibacteria bacterium]|nr:hypothetical protein [Candidatus Saccharibacteria bacterium]